MTHSYLLRVGAACAAISLGFALAASALAADTLQGAAVLEQKLDRSAMAAQAMALPVEARLTPAQSAALKSLGRNFGRTGNQAAVMQGWQAYLAASRPAPGDVDGLIALVLRESYLQGSEDLRHAAAKVQHNNQQKAKIREQLNGSGSGAPTATFRLHPGLLQMQVQPADDGQLANIDLQNATQRQQQALQSTANISKMMHDTAMAIIRKMN